MTVPFLVFFSRKLRIPFSVSTPAHRKFVQSCSRIPEQYARVIAPFQSALGAAAINRATSSPLNTSRAPESFARGSVAETGLYFVFPSFLAFSKQPLRNLRTILSTVEFVRPSHSR